MIRLIGIDVDGTLLDSDGRLPDANRAAIHQAVEIGVHVALVTGRSYPFVRPVADTLPSSISLIVSNGAVERSTDGSTLARRLLDRRVARRVLHSTRQHRDSAALVFDRDADRQVVFETMDWEHPGRQRYWSRNHSHIAQSVPLEDALTEDPIQVMFNGGVEAMRPLAVALRGVMQQSRSGMTWGPPMEPPTWGPPSGGPQFSVLMTEYIHRDFSLVDVTAPDATKGHALAWRAQQLGLTRDEVMAVGDNFNDVEMLEFAGTPVVMGNAVDELKTSGRFVTGHQNDAGLAQAIERFVLQR
ncbi:MAG TPA: HAD family hydrolase [Vicinamibacterales bacterium]|nr:HAD family hydrolase [Vicinamibacterales bacterium]